MTEKEKYAQEWNASAQYFSDKEYYRLLSEQIGEYKTVLEIGCGTGQSTLSLLAAGHTVVAIDQNQQCIDRAKKLVKESGYAITDDVCTTTPQTVCFVECDVTDSYFEQQIFPHIYPDIVICWNIGSYWDKEKVVDVIPKMVEYGLSFEQICANVESSYGELIMWRSCAIAKAKECAVHLVDRWTHVITEANDPYYSLLQRELGFEKIGYANIRATSLSKGGRQLVSNGKVNTQKEIPIVFVSILMK